jgi:hypothetical protein
MVRVETEKASRVYAASYFLNLLPIGETVRDTPTAGYRGSGTRLGRGIDVSDRALIEFVNGDELVGACYIPSYGCPHGEFGVLAALETVFERIEFERACEHADTDEHDWRYAPVYLVGKYVFYLGELYNRSWPPDSPLVEILPTDPSSYPPDMEYVYRVHCGRMEPNGRPKISWQPYVVEEHARVKSKMED